MRDRSLLDLTLAAAVKDAPSVAQDSRPLAGLPDGMREQRMPLHADDRGELTEIWSKRLGFDAHPVEHIYLTTVRPGAVKGWALHKRHEDRYFLVSGEVMLALYDVRPESSTCGRTFRVFLSERDRRLVNIPAFVWHADANYGTTDALIVNLPTRAYDPADPDKWRLPVGTPHIPFDFGPLRGY